MTPEIISFYSKQIIAMCESVPDVDTRKHLDLCRAHQAERLRLINVLISRMKPEEIYDLCVRLLHRFVVQLEIKRKRRSSLARNLDDLRRKFYHHLKDLHHVFPNGDGRPGTDDVAQSIQWLSISMQTYRDFGNDIELTTRGFWWAFYLCNPELGGCLVSYVHAICARRLHDVGEERFNKRDGMLRPAAARFEAEIWDDVVRYLFEKVTAINPPPINYWYDFGRKPYWPHAY